MARCTCLARHPKTKFALRVLYASIGIAIGVIAAVVFGIHFGNRDAAIWALISAVCSCFSLTLFIYLYVVREVLSHAPNRWVLLSFGILGSVVMTVSFGAFISYLGLGILDSINHTSPHPLYRTHYITCVWTFAAFRAGLSPYLYSVFSFKYCPGTKPGYLPVNTSDVNDMDGD